MTAPEFLIAYNEKNGYPTSKDSLFEILTESNTVYIGDRSEHRWWTEVYRVCKIEDKLIGFIWAESTGDNCASDLGWEPNLDSIHFCEAYREITVKYRELQDDAMASPTDEELYNKHRNNFLEEAGKEAYADAAALQRYINAKIIDRDFIVWPPKTRDRYEVFDNLPKYQVIFLAFGIDGDPIFGIPGDDDGERAIQVSTSRGIRLINVNG